MFCRSSRQFSYFVVLLNSSQKLLQWKRAHAGTSMWPDSWKNAVVIGAKEAWYVILWIICFVAAKAA
jgi:hypothetical protein